MNVDSSIPLFPERMGGKYSRWKHKELLKELPKNQLEKLYYVQKQSTKQIALRYGVAQSTIWRLFKCHGLRVRTLHESMALLRKPATKYKRIRWRALRLLGGRCLHCGCDDLRILEVHHKAGGGRRERREVGGDGFYRNVVMGRRRLDDLEAFYRPCHAVQDIKRVYGVDSFHVEWRRS